MKGLYLFILMLTFCASWISADDYTYLCRLFKANITIAMPGECDKYIKCQSNGIGQVHTCEAPSVAFDVKTQSCVDKVDKDSLCRNRCEGKNEIWTAHPNSCHGFYYCIDGVPNTGYCNEGMYFDESQQMCVHSASSSCVYVSNLCELVPDKTKFRDETDCSRYYECANKKQTRKACSKTYFNVATQSCVDKSTVTCRNHPIPKNICKVGKKPFVGFKADQATCRGYFHCANFGIVEDLEPVWSQCPEGLFFSEPDQACRKPVDAKCVYNRCEGRGNHMVSSSKNHCHNYLICENGFVVKEKTCPYDYFFNEEYQSCVPDIIDYNCCDS